MSRSRRPSDFIKSLGGYGRPVPGEELLTGYGKAIVLRVIPYEEVVEEMRKGFVPAEEIERFDSRVEHFLGRRARYFEAELACPDGAIERIDWSEYLAMKNKGKR